MVEASDTEFTISLSWAELNGKQSGVAFQLPRKEAFAAAKKFKQSSAHDEVIFEPVQKAIAELEEKVGQMRRQS